MDIGLLVLRLALSAILVAHASQKTFGWFQGSGIAVMGNAFESLGLKPGRAMVATASIVEVLAAISLATGLLVPLGAAAGAAAMLVAGATMHLAAGRFWNAAGGGEYPYLLSVAIASLSFIGPGAISLDELLVRAAPALAPFANGWLVGLFTCVLALIAALPLLLILQRHRASKKAAAAV